MAKKALLTVDGTYRKVKKGLFTLDSVYRKVKKAYLTVGGVYRPCWAGGELVNFGLITPLSTTKYDVSAASVPNYAVFAGGVWSGVMSATADAYDRNLTRTTLTSLSVARRGIAPASVGGCAIFAGGTTGSNSKVVDCYNSALTRTTLTAMRYGRAYYGSATSPHYAMFAGGLTASGGLTADAYSEDLTRVNMPNLTGVNRYNNAGASVAGYGLFAGGSGSGSSNGWLAYVDCYSDTLSHSVLTSLSVGRNQLRGATVGNFALFAGGQSGSGVSTAVVDVYDESLIRSSADNLSLDRQGPTSASNFQETAIFLGGYSYTTSANSDVVDAYSKELTHTIAPSTTYAFSSSNNGCTVIGDYALVALSSSSSSGMDAYTFV